MLPVVMATIALHGQDPFQCGQNQTLVKIQIY